MSSSQTPLIEMAKQAMSFSHSPYSEKKIGAAILLSNGKIYSGCNVENASYGGTVCAERVAIWKAVSENKNTEITEVVVASDSEKPWPPCGFCRQVLAEFAKPETQVTIVNLQNLTLSYKFKDLFPEAFGPSSF